MADALFDVGNEVAVITGVSGQLGLQYAKAFLSRDAKVAGLDIGESEAVRELQRSHPQQFMFVPGNVTDAASLVQASEAIEARFGRPTVLVNNAALDSPPDAPLSENGPFEDYPDSSFDRIMDVNVKGVYLCCKHFGKAMAAAGRGSIINISSIYGVVSPDQSIYQYRRDRGETYFKPVAYAVSKSALLNLTRYLATYWGRQGVRVNSLVLAGVSNGQDAQFVAAYNARIPIGRMAAQDEYNGAVLFLASPASRYMTGSTLVVDGGWTAI